MTEIELKTLTDANWPIKNSPQGFEGKALLTAWAKQLHELVCTPNVTCGEINTCIVRLADIAKEVTYNSQPEINNT